MVCSEPNIDGGRDNGRRASFSVGTSEYSAPVRSRPSPKSAMQLAVAAKSLFNEAGRSCSSWRSRCRSCDCGTVLWICCKSSLRFRTILAST